MGGEHRVNLLLDTHVWIWLAEGSPRLPRRIREALAHPDAVLWVSPVTAWEALMLAERGRLKLPPKGADWVRRILDEGPFEEAPLTWEIALRSRKLDVATRDPADRFLISTAIENDFTFVTADARLKQMRGVALLAFDPVRS